MKTLVIAPHADDAEFGCGGYIARLGQQAIIAVLSASDYTNPHGVVVQRETRIAEQRESARVLGCRLQEPLKPEDGGMIENYFPGHEARLIGLVEGLLDVYRPEEVLFPLPSFNQDHKATYEAVVTALRPSRWLPDRALAYEYPMNCWGPQVPNMGKVYFPLTLDTLSKKTDALRCHHSQTDMRRATIAGEAGWKALARMRGLECGHPYAELFYLHMEVLRVDPGSD